MKKVLIITYYWPPASGPGVQRTLKFCKYLPDSNIEPIVLTVKDGSYQSIDHSLLDDIPTNTRVHSTKSFEVYRVINRFLGKKNSAPSVGMIGLKNKGLMARLKLYVRANYFIPDMRKGWNKYALVEAEKIIKEENIDLIYSTGPPHSTHLIAEELKKNLNVKWIADFRDPWTNIFYNKMFPRTSRTIERDQDLENSVLKNADHVITVSEGLKNEFVGRNKNINVIYNGYDSTDFDYIEKSGDKNKFVISYIGNFKPNQQVEDLWMALSKLTKSNADFKKDLVIELTGNVDKSILKEIEQVGLKGNLKQNSFLSHKEAVQKMVESDILLFIIPKVLSNHLILTGKLFEYLASGTEMLSIGPVAGNADVILNECGRSTMLNYNQQEEMSSMIESAFSYWKKNDGQSRKLPVNNAVKQYSRKGQTETLGKIMNQL